MAVAISLHTFSGHHAGDKNRSQASSAGDRTGRGGATLQGCLGGDLCAEGPGVHVDSSGRTQVYTADKCPGAAPPPQLTGTEPPGVLGPLCYL